MPLMTSTPRAVTAVQIEADHWGITGFTVRTPQDGTPTTVQVFSEAWQATDGGRVGVTPLAVSELIGDGAVQALLTIAAQAYDTYRTSEVADGQALYLAIRDALHGLKQHEGTFPRDAETPEALAAQIAAAAAAAALVSSPEVP